EREMLAAAEDLEFERAAALRDRVLQLKENIGKPLSEVEETKPSKSGMGRQRKGKKGARGGGGNRSRVPRPKRG
ncbi:MAG: UvrB/UvrC motif-containing protein, partial [Planctomycetota bacterium]